MHVCRRRGEPTWLARAASCRRSGLPTLTSPGTTLVFHVAALPFQLPAPLLAVTRRQVGLGGRRELEGGEASRDFDGRGRWREDHRNHGFLHGLGRVRRLHHGPT